jgi:glycine/D-amino acid oxidase-like deaminating enzyme
MNVSGEKSTSLWMGTKVVDDAPALNRGEKADVAVVGSGTAGMSVAYELFKAGKDVVVIDRGPIGKGMTSRTTAHLTAQCDDGFHQLISRRGEETAKLWYQSQAASIDRIEANVKDLGIDCDFRRLDGHLFHAQGTDPGIIDQEFEATQKVGMPISREKGVPLRTHEKTPSLRYPNQATFLSSAAGIAPATAHSSRQTGLRSTLPPFPRSRKSRSNSSLRIMWAEETQPAARRRDDPSR